MADSLSSSAWTKLQKEHADAKENRSLGKLIKDYEQAAGQEDTTETLKVLEQLVKELKAAAKKASDNAALSKSLAQMIKDAEAEYAECESEAEEDEDEEEGRAGLAKLLAVVKKRDRDKPLNFVAALGRPSGLIVTRKKIAQAHIKEAKEIREGNGAIFEGICYGAKDKWVFELTEAPPPGIAKQLKQAALVHADMLLKVLVRGGGVELDDEQDVDPTAAAEAKASRESGAPQEAAGAVAYAKLLLAYDNARKKIRSELQRLETAILAEYENDSELEEVKSRVRRLDDIVERLDDSLRDALDDAIGVVANEREEFHKQARSIVDDLRLYLEKNQFVKDVQENPFGVVVSVPLMVQTLEVIAKRIA